MKNFLYIGAKGVATAGGLRKWIRRSLRYALTLKPKADGLAQRARTNAPLKRGPLAL